MTSSFFKVDNMKNEAVLRDFLIFRSWQHQKRSNSATLLHFLDWTTSKMKQFCETYSIFEFDNIKKNKSARLPSKTESWVQSWQPRTNAFCHFSSPPVESIACATKKSCQVIRSAAPVTQNHLRKSAPSPPNSSDQDVSCTAPATENASLQILFKCPTLAIMLQNPHDLLTLDKVLNPLRLPRETRSERPKVVRTWCALSILTWKCASRRNGVHFCDISTSKSGPKLVCFVHFDFDMCFAPQRRALFRHRNFQKCSDRAVLLAFSLANALRATTACTFATSQLPKVVRQWCALYILTSKCASRHNGVHFFISHLASWLRTRRFSEPTVRPSGARNHWKNIVFRDFPTFSRTCIFFLLTLSLLWSSLFWLFLFSDLLSSPLLSSTLLFSLTLSISSFHLSILSEVWLLNFLRI